MKKGSPKHLRWSLLKKYEVSLDPDGNVFQNDDLLQPDREVILSYRDEGPDAWANSQYFDGPAWLWTEHEGWEYWKKGVKITGYYCLDATLVTIENGIVHVTKITGEEY